MTHTEYMREYRKRHPERDRAAHARYWARNGAAINAANRLRRASQPPAKVERQCLDCGTPSGLRLRCPEHWRANRSAAARRWHERRGQEHARTYRSSPRGRASGVAWQHNETAARYGLPGRVTGDDLRALIDDCAYCGGRQVGWDHIVPMSRGGDNIPANLAPCCKTCNESKGTRTPSEWLAAGLYGPSVATVLA